MTLGRALLGVAVVLIVLGFVIHWAVAAAGVVLFDVGLRAAGQRPFAGGGASGGTDGYVP